MITGRLLITSIIKIITSQIPQQNHASVDTALYALGFNRSLIDEKTRDECSQRNQ